MEQDIGEFKEVLSSAKVWESMLYDILNMLEDLEEEMGKEFPQDKKLLEKAADIILDVYADVEVLIGELEEKIKELKGGST